MILIREADPEDYQFLPEIEADAAQVFRAVGLAGIADMQPNPPEYYKTLLEPKIILLAEYKSVPAGFGVAYPVDGQAYLREVSVKQAFSGRGIGRQLVEALIQKAIAQGYDKMILRTFRDIPFNTPFYQKLGFEIFEPDTNWPELTKIIGHEKTAGLELKPRVFMILNLESPLWDM